MSPLQVLMSLQSNIADKTEEKKNEYCKFWNMQVIETQPKSRPYADRESIILPSCILCS